MATRRKQPEHPVDLDEEEEVDEPEAEDDELPANVYYVERVVDKKVQDSELRYFVKWVGYHENENTWETMDNLDNSQEALIRFEDKISKSKKKGGKVFPPPSKNIDEAYCRRERAKVVRENEIIEILCFFPDTCRFVVKYDDCSCVLLQPAEYVALPFEKKIMFAEFLAKIDRECNTRIMDNLKKKDELIQRAREQAEREERARLGLEDLPEEDEDEEEDEAAPDVHMADNERGAGGDEEEILIESDSDDN